MNASSRLDAFLVGLFSRQVHEPMRARSVVSAQMRGKARRHSRKESRFLDDPPKQDPAKVTRREKALAKLEASAKEHTVRRNASSIINSFKEEALCAIAFARQLRLILDVQLTPLESEALLEVFDHDGDGYVDGPEFVSLFLRMVDTHRTANVQRLKELRKRRGESMKRHEESFIAHGEATGATRPPISRVPWKAHHLRRASAKVAAAAAR